MTTVVVAVVDVTGGGRVVVDVGQRPARRNDTQEARQMPR